MATLFVPAGIADQVSIGAFAAPSHVYCTGIAVFARNASDETVSTPVPRTPRRLRENQGAKQDPHASESCNTCSGRGFTRPVIR